MSLNINVPEQKNLRPKITVLGIGGAGGNAVNNMIELDLQGVEFAVANTDAQALEASKAGKKIQLGENLTEGLGAGSSPDIGSKAAEESIDRMLSEIGDSNMLFITAGMGGGTGTGAAPVIAKAARERGILTVGVVTKPFHFEGSYRMEVATSGVDELYRTVDTLIVIPNQNLFHKANEQTTFADAFQMVDNVLYSGVKSITDLMTMPGLINLDFADIRTIMGSMGKAMMGTGEASGERRALEAAEAAISNPLLDNASMRGASGVLINISGGLDMTLFEADEAAQRIKDELAQDANIIFGSTFDKTLDSQIRVSVVATGIDADITAKVSTNPLKNKAQDHRSEGEPSVAKGFAEQSVNIEGANIEGGFIPPQPVLPGELYDAGSEDILINQTSNEAQANVENANVSNVENIYTASTGQNDVNVNQAANEQYQSQYRQVSGGGVEYSNQPHAAASVTSRAVQGNQYSNSEQYKSKETYEKGKIGKSLSGFFNLFKEANEQEVESRDKRAENIADYNNSRQYTEAHRIETTNQESDLTISDDILNVPTFLRKKETDD